MMVQSKQNNNNANGCQWLSNGQTNHLEANAKVQPKMQKKLDQYKERLMIRGITILLLLCLFFSTESAYKFTQKDNQEDEAIRINTKLTQVKDTLLLPTV
jgi:hypothetical protein